MRYLITAGPTREPIDKVRYLSNRSSGQMGIAIANAAVEAGHHVTLLTGPGVSGAPSNECQRHLFETTADLQALLQSHWPNHDALVMAAAVSDYTIEKLSKEKIARLDDGTLTLNLTPTPDLVALTAKNRQPHQRVIAFALEHYENLIERATEKLERKAVDAIVANPLQTIDAPHINATWIQSNGQTDSPGDMLKQTFANWLIEKIETLFP